jgi:ATP-dependent helicase/nuclease subunit A
MIGVPMKEMERDVDSEELVLVQGIIDVYFEEEDGLVLLDYKTDYVEKNQGEKLVEKYRAQLQWYKRALEQMTGKKVKETLIYSFRLSKSLTVDKI